MKRIILFSSLILSLTGLARAEGTTDYYSLERAINQALDTNFQIRRARESAKKSRGVYIEARAAVLPQVNGTGSYSKFEQRLRPLVNGTPTGIDKRWTARVEATQSLLVGGEDVASALRDRLLKQAAVEALKSEINDVVFLVHEQFYRVLLNRAQVVVREQAIKLLEGELNSAKRKLEAGTVSNFNVLRAEVALANAQTPFIQARNEYQLSTEDFRRLLGLFHKRGAEDIPVELTGELDFVETNPELDSATEKALANRPELKQLEKEFKAGKRDVWAARSEYLPDVKGFAAYEKGTSAVSTSVEDTTEGWEAGVRGEWKFFNSGESWGRVKQAKAERTISEIDLEEARLIVELETHRSYSTLIESVELVKASEKVVEQAQESLRLAQARVDAGVATQLDLLDSQVALTDARTNKIQALFQFNVALARYRRAVGEFVTEDL